MKKPPEQSSRRWNLALLALSLAFSACGPERPPLSPADFASVSNLRLKKPDRKQSYTLQVGDQVDFKFFYNPELNDLVTIRPDGMIGLQLIGEIRAQGLSPLDLKKIVAEKYQGILRHPEVTVIVRKFAPEKVYVGGQVKSPGAIPIDGPISALQAITTAGGFTFGALQENVVVLTRDGNNNYGYRILDFNSHLALTDSQDILLQPNDIIFVPQTGVNEVAQYFRENINEIFPMWKNSGFSFPFFYSLNPQTSTTIRTER